MPQDGGDGGGGSVAVVLISTFFRLLVFELLRRLASWVADVIVDRFSGSEAAPA